MIRRLLSGAWSGASVIKNSLYDFQLIEKVKVKTKVVSIGNLTWGGTGKTPITMDLLQRTKARYPRRAVISRNYKALVRAACEVDRSHAGPAEYYGDEPALIANTLEDVRVFVGPKKYRTALWLESQLLKGAVGSKLSDHLDLVFIDDGFQHRRLHRDLDIVLVDARECSPIIAVPSGPYREKFQSLDRAHVVVLTHVSEASDWQLAWVRGLLPENLLTVECNFTNELSFKFELKAAVAAFAGLAKAPGFFQRLESQLSVPLVKTWDFGDHCAYGPEVLAELTAWIEKNPETSLLTTAKDAVKIGSLLSKYPQIQVVHQRVEWGKGFDELLQKLHQLSL